MVFSPVDSTPCIIDVPKVPISVTGSGLRPGLIHHEHCEGLGAVSYPVTSSTTLLYAKSGDPQDVMSPCEMRKRQGGSTDVCDCLRASDPGSWRSKAYHPNKRCPDSRVLGVIPIVGRLVGVRHLFELAQAWAGPEVSTAISETLGLKYCVLGGYSLCPLE
ncbi:hypothetical protein E2562_036173 [Oryza meyeriana var. granulata]|uniref:Uncharacterized protein n=1 Tax=Oryza meyeriana var. granulata TaxID=110450 RepID=A0A6G1CW53_9ORYZ|nr:hypothetical protein E2562_036173 [Oryza meyeriana var. granulata]